MHKKDVDVLPTQEKAVSPPTGRRWLTTLILIGCLLSMGIASWYGISLRQAGAAPQSLPSNPVVFLRETYEGAAVNVIAYSSKSGRELWTHKSTFSHMDYLERSNGLRYALDGNVIYYVSKCKLFAVSAQNGQSIWKRDLLQTGQTFCYAGNLLLDKVFNRLYVVGTVSNEPIQEVPVGPGEPPMRYLPSASDPRLLAFQASTGRFLWQNTTVGSQVYYGAFVSTGPFTVDQGFIYTTRSPFADTADQRKLIALSGQNGATLWEDSRPNEEVMSLVATHGTVFAETAQLSEDRGSFTGFTLAALKGTDRTQLWSQPLATSLPTSLVIYQGNIFTRTLLETQQSGTYHTSLSGYDPTTGKMVASSDSGQVSNPELPGFNIQANSTAIYLTSGFTTAVQAIQPDTGAVLWTSATFDNITDIQVVDTSIIFLSRTATKETFLISLESTSGQIRWQQLLP